MLRQVLSAEDFLEIKLNNDISIKTYKSMSERQNRSGHLNSEDWMLESNHIFLTLTMDMVDPASFCTILMSTTEVVVKRTCKYMDTYFQSGFQHNHHNEKDIDYYKPEKFVGYQKDHFHNVVNELDQSGFYYRGFSREDVCDLLKDKEPGDFIVRESRSMDWYFTLTFKNQNHDIKNVRIGYSFGIFYFETSKKKFSDCKITSESVVKLIELHLKKNLPKNKQSLTKQIYLIKPFKHSISSLKHICRVCINQRDDDVIDNLPKHLKDYTSNYPYKL